MSIKDMQKIYEAFINGKPQKKGNEMPSIIFWEGTKKNKQNH